MGYLLVEVTIDVDVTCCVLTLVTVAPALAKTVDTEVVVVGTDTVLDSVVVVGTSLTLVTVRSEVAVLFESVIRWMRDVYFRASTM